MTSYSTIQLHRLSRDLSADALDGMYAYEAKANDDIDRDGKIDHFEAQIQETKKLDAGNLSGLHGRADGGMPLFQMKRYFADDTGALWDGYSVIDNGGREHLGLYERHDGTKIDDNLTDGNFYIAPEDIGRAFKNKTGNAEFTNFVSGVLSTYKELAKKVIAHLNGQQLAASAMNGDALLAASADPDKSLIDILKMMYKAEALDAIQGEIELLDLHCNYLVEAGILNGKNAAAYALPSDFPLIDVGSGSKVLSVFNEVSPLLSVASGGKSGVMLHNLNTRYLLTVLPEEEARETAALTLAPTAVAPVPTPLTAPAPPVAAGPAPAHSINIYGLAKSRDLAVLQSDVTEINRLFPGVLPAGLQFGHGQINVGGPKKNWPDQITDDKGAFKIAFLGDKTYPYSEDGVYDLHVDLWNYVKKKVPEKFYFGAAGLDVGPVSLKQDTGFLDFESGDVATSDKPDLDRIAMLLKSANAAELAGVTVTGYASASGEKIKGPDGKIYTIVENSYAKSMAGKIKISDCIGANEQPKSGYAWIEGQTPPTGANDTTSAKGKIDKITAYLKAQGVNDEILRDETLFKTVRAGGRSKGGARLEFTWKEVPDFKLRVADFKGIAPDKQGALASFLMQCLNDEGYFEKASAIVKTSGTEAAKEEMLLKNAAFVEVELRKSFDAATAESIAGQIFDKIAGQRSIAGGNVLAAVLNASFFRGQRTPPAGAPLLGASVPAASAAAATASPRTGAKMADTYTFSNPTTFTLSSINAPTIQMSPGGGSENIREIRRAFDTKEIIGFRTSSCSPTACTVVLDGMLAYAKDYRRRKLAANPMTSADEQAKYGVMPYDLDVTFKDGSVKRIRVTATGI